MLQIQKNICIVQYLFFSSYINHKPQTIYTTNYKVRVTAISSYKKFKGEIKMFNTISNDVYEKICNMMFEYHNMMISSYKQLNNLYNACYCPIAIKQDILDIVENDIYLSDVNLAKMGF